MALRDFSHHLEIGGIILAIMEFLGVGKFVDQFITWQVKQLRLFVAWYRGQTLIKGLNSQISNINYFFILFFLISSFFTYIDMTIRQVPITGILIFISIGTTVVLYLLFLKVLIPVLELIIGSYIVLLSILNTKGILAIAGITIALTGFVISQVNHSAQ